MIKPTRIIKEIIKKPFNIPGIPEIYFWASNLAGRPLIYDCCWRHLPNWLEELNKCERAADRFPRCRVLFFSTLSYWINYSLALSVVLVGRNVDVDFAWLLHPQIIEGNTTIGYRHWQHSYAANRSRFTHPKLRLYNLEDVAPCLVTNEMEDIARKQALIDVSYLLKKERLRINSEPLDSSTFELRRKQNLEAISRVAALINQNQYDRVIVPNGVSLDFGAVYSYLSNRGIPVSSIEMWDIDKRVVVSKDAPVVQINTDNLWDQDAPHFLSESTHMRVQKIIETRQEPATKALTVIYQRAKLESSEQIREQLGLYSDKPIVLICPNVPFDSIFYVERKKNFLSMREWLVKTVEYLGKRTDCQAIIRSHPAEVYYDVSETTKSLISDIFPVLPAHIKVVSPKAPINTYSIMQIADMGIVYASTTGLEMAMRGIPVVCGISNQHYNRKGFTIDPETPEEYFIQIDRILRDPIKFRLTERSVELSWCYADLYFNRWPLRFPWHVTTLECDLKKWPIRRMLSQDGDEKFGEVFNILSTPNQ
jgi:hypothetical protein